MLKCKNAGMLFAKRLNKKGIYKKSFSRTLHTVRVLFLYDIQK
jgi:hypothetical protein